MNVAWDIAFNLTMLFLKIAFYLHLLACAWLMLGNYEFLSQQM
jgi:hypothetical protein